MHVFWLIRGNSIYFFHYDSNVNKIRFFIFENLKAKRLFLFCKQTGLFIRYFPLIRGNDQLFLCLKEKVAKRSKPTCGWIAGACGSELPRIPPDSAQMHSDLQGKSEYDIACRNRRHGFGRRRLFGEPCAYGNLAFGGVHRRDCIDPHRLI